MVYNLHDGQQKERLTMRYSKPVSEVIKQRFSCRSHQAIPIEVEKRQALEAHLAQIEKGPFGAPLRFKLVAAAEKDSAELKDLGTYGMIRDPGGFILGAVGAGDRNLEDFGYCMEESILLATDLDLGTCWLGGFFTRSTFAARMGLGGGEEMPAVTSVGHLPDKASFKDRIIRRLAGAHSRLPWETLFFERRFGASLSPEDAGGYAVPLEMVRLGPSASNKQPWRVIEGDGAWHFYLQRTPGYGQGRLNFGVMSDLQRLDMGIALCHFELAAREAGLDGRWVLDEPNLEMPDDLVEYTTSWIEG
jgi:nitroreductase